MSVPGAGGGGIASLRCAASHTLHRNGQPDAAVSSRRDGLGVRVEQELDALRFQLCANRGRHIRILARQELGIVLQHGNRRAEIGKHRGKLKSNES